MNRIFNLILIAGMLAAAPASRGDFIAETYDDGDILSAQKMNAIKDAVNDNDARIFRLDGFNYLVDAPGNVIGSVVGMDTATWTIVNTSGYLVRVRGDGFPAGELVYFDGQNCTGTPYLYLIGASNSTPQERNPAFARQGYVVTDIRDTDIYYVPKHSTVQRGIGLQSRILRGGCQNTTESIDAVQMLRNVPSVTGVPATGYGEVSLP